MKMRKRMKMTAVILSVIMTASPILACAQESNANETIIPVEGINGAGQSQETQEYIVLANDDEGIELAESVGQQTDEASDVLTDNGVTVVEMTAAEAEELQEDDSILLIEENILLEGSTYDPEEFELEPMNLSPEEERELKMSLKAQREEKPFVSADEQWNIDMVASNHGEYESVSGNGIKVAILDSGVSASDDLPVKERINFIDGEDDIDPLYEDLSGHGTGVAGVIIGKDNGWGVTGINPNANLYSLRVLDGTNKAPLSRIVSAIYWCIDNDINIMNMSFGTTTQSAILENAIKDADEAGILMIAAAGNHGIEDPNVMEYPAAFDEVMAVGAVNPQGQISELSSIGSVTEILAPGESVPVMDFLDEISPADGTSMATPHITGIASLLWAKDETKPADFVRKLMKASARSIDTGAYGIADLDYALQIYDSFAEQYAENPQTAITSVSANTLSPDTYDDSQVEALWSVANHQSAIDLSSSITTGVKNVIKIAQYAADNDSSLKGTNSDQKRFHGHYNYVANYVYMMRIARNVYNSGSINPLNFDYAIQTAVWPTSETNTTSEIVIKNRIENLNYSTYFSQIGVSDNASNRARFIVGLALHSAMDAYAHEAYIPSGGSYVRITDTTLQDTTTYIPNRYNVAKAVALDIIDVWHYGYTPDESEFYQTSHNGSLFRLGNLRKHAKKVNPNMSQSDETWYSNHGYDHS